jgi:hypothetical protein
MTRLRRPTATVGTGACILAALVASTVQVGYGDDAPPAPHGMEVRIIDRMTKQPIPGATLKVRRCDRTFDQNAEPNGDWRIPLRVPTRRISP